MNFKKKNDTIIIQKKNMYYHYSFIILEADLTSLIVIKGISL